MQDQFVIRYRDIKGSIIRLFFIKQLLHFAAVKIADADVQIIIDTEPNTGPSVRCPFAAADSRAACYRTVRHP